METERQSKNLNAAHDRRCPEYIHGALVVGRSNAETTSRCQCHRSATCRSTITESAAACASKKTDLNALFLAQVCCRMSKRRWCRHMPTLGRSPLASWSLFRFVALHIECLSRASVDNVRRATWNLPNTAFDPWTLDVGKGCTRIC
eukprot:3076388-Rhodomonas_salina.4